MRGSEQGRLLGFLRLILMLLTQHTQAALMAKAQHVTFLAVGIAHPVKTLVAAAQATETIAT
ncbi:hypothetical protein PANA5342_2473 [Pantoea ananatis LMG 5342]|nr:hypothetical protein PANA5342_2473 [Pantoea ananatis LMG 5342]